MAESIDQLKESFVEETHELINELEEVLLALETDNVEQASIDKIFRNIHTIKGSGGMLGFDKVLEITHELENIYDKVRDGNLVYTSELRDISLATLDVLKFLAVDDKNLSTEQKSQYSNLSRKIKLYGKKAFEQAGIASIKGNDDDNESIETFLIKFKPGEHIKEKVENPAFLIEELILMGKHLLFSRINRKIEMNKLEYDEDVENWVIILATSEPQNYIEEIFEFVKDACELSIKPLIEGNLLNVEDAVSAFEDIKRSIFSKSFKELHHLAEQFESSIKENEVVTKQKGVRLADDLQIGSANQLIKSIRVDSEKVDQLMNLVSEMVTLQARLNLYAEKKDEVELSEIAEKYAGFSKQLRDNAFSISLVPFGITLTRYKRLVHDLSDQLDKQIEFVTVGEETVLDKKIIEQLSDPMMHLLRNSIDHGIESPEDRVKAGKSELGKIHMEIYHRSNNVFIEISDDGKGIDAEQIKKLAIDKGLIESDVNLTENETLNLVFLPGFSSAKTVSNVSGRGVGLDVVKRNISKIRGEIEIDTEKGKGTKFTIKLPLTLSIIDGLMVQIGVKQFVIPLIQVERIYSIDTVEQSSGINQFLKLDGRQIPYFDLRKDFGIGGEPPVRQELVLVNFEKESVALIVDSVVGENQTVLKPMGKHFKNQDFISGGTILGDGTVALVLDVNKIVTVFSKNKIKL